MIIPKHLSYQPFNFSMKKGMVSAYKKYLPYSDDTLEKWFM
jgi:hypothetical protein